MNSELWTLNWREHLTHICTVLQQLHQAGLTAKPQKCQFTTKECVYLGHVGGGQVKPLPSKVDAVSSYPIPQTKQQVCTFLGSTGYYRKFIPNRNNCSTDRSYKEICANSGSVDTYLWPGIWKVERTTLLQTSTEHLDFSKPFILQTDASNRGVGAVLTQIDDNSEEYISQLHTIVRSFFPGKSDTQWLKRNVWPYDWESRPSEFTCMDVILPYLP